MTKVINLYGGPGTGKSTLAARLFTEMKGSKLSCELVREYVKDWAWEGKQIGKFDQMYFLAKQFRRESILYNKVDYVITDSPFLMAGFYAEHYLNQTFVTEVALEMRKLAEEEGVVFCDFFLKRYKDYDTKGRYETENQAREIDNKMRSFLEGNNINIININSEDNKKDAEIIKHLIPFHSFA